MLISEENIVSVIPQRAPFVMIDALLESTETSTKTGFSVRRSNLFFENDFLRESALVENIAQTAAAGVGYRAQQNGTEVPVGFIGAIQHLEIFQLPKENDWLETEVTVTNQVFDVSFIRGTIHCKNELLAQCDMKIFLSKQ
jgi:predicted hotdog family 3-hydroxylacyl-ACP dehydratase